MTPLTAYPPRPQSIETLARRAHLERSFYIGAAIAALVAAAVNALRRAPR
jgi:hypothetical protein